MTRWLTVAVIAVAIVSVAALVWVFLPAASEDADPAGQTLTDGGANGVDFIATYNGTSEGVSRFFVRLETHTVDLDAYDPLASVVVEHAGDEARASASSKVVSRSGHHVAATLEFETGPTHDKIVLIAKELGGVPERRLVFEA